MQETKKYPVNLTVKLVLLVEPSEDGTYPSSFDVQDAVREALVDHLDHDILSDSISEGLECKTEGARIDYSEITLHEEQPGDAGGPQIQYTFAVGQMGPSSDGDSGSYYLTSIERPDPGLSGPEERQWAEAQLLEELEEQGDHLGERVAFVVYMGQEDVAAGEDDDAED